MLGSGPGRNPAAASSVCTEKKKEKKTQRQLGRWKSLRGITSNVTKRKEDSAINIIN